MNHSRHYTQLLEAIEPLCLFSGINEDFITIRSCGFKLTFYMSSIDPIETMESFETCLTSALKKKNLIIKDLPQDTPCEESTFTSFFWYEEEAEIESTCSFIENALTDKFTEHTEYLISELDVYGMRAICIGNVCFTVSSTSIAKKIIERLLSN